MSMSNNIIMFRTAILNMVYIIVRKYFRMFSSFDIVNVSLNFISVKIIIV